MKKENLKRDFWSMIWLVVLLNIQAAPETSGSPSPSRTIMSRGRSKNVNLYWPDSTLWKTDFDRFVFDNSRGQTDFSRSFDFPNIEDFHPNEAIRSIKDHSPLDRNKGRPFKYFYENKRNPKFRKFRPGPYQGGAGGCKVDDGFRFDGETWYTMGCRRHKCIHFRGTYFVETDSCDTEIYNTVYKCIIEVDIKADYPNCCPRYNCNPDNLGNRVNVT